MCLFEKRLVRGTSPFILGADVSWCFSIAIDLFAFSACYNSARSLGHDH